MVLLVGWIEEFKAASEIDLDDNQFNFIKGRSTDNAVRALHQQLVRAHDSKKLAIVVSLNTRNAFISVD